MKNSVQIKNEFTEPSPLKKLYELEKKICTKIRAICKSRKKPKLTNRFIPNNLRI